MTKSESKTGRRTHPALSVRLGNNLHAIPIAAVEEVLPALPVETIPQCPSFVRGVVFGRGHLIPVLDAAERLGVQGHPRTPEPHIVCLLIGNRLVGVEFDEAIDLIEIHGMPKAAKLLAAATCEPSPRRIAAVLCQLATR